MTLVAGDARLSPGGGRTPTRAVCPPILETWISTTSSRWPRCIAVSASSNRSKRDRDPALWLPPNRAYHCEYLKTWVEPKSHWGLSTDPVQSKLLAESKCLSAK